MDPSSISVRLVLQLMGGIVFVWWALFFYKKFNRLYTVHLKDFFAPDVNKMAKYPVAARYDAVNIENKFWRYYFSGIFLVPLRFGIFALVATIGSLWTWSLMKIFGLNYQNSQDFHNPYFNFLVRLVVTPLAWLEFVNAGFKPYTKIKHSIYDYLPDYQPTQDTRLAPIVLSNHCSFLEIFAHWQENISFLAKSSTSDIPFLGTLVLSKQMVYITSHTEEGRKETDRRLKERLKKNMEGKYPQINVYPEGTINNSETILKFKKGGFDHTFPIRIRCSRFF